MKNETEPSLLQFPCPFPIKAMGRKSEDFERVVSEIIFSHARLVVGELLKVTPSRAGNYVSVTAVIQAESQEQLDNIYRQLTACEQVLMAL